MKKFISAFIIVTIFAINFCTIAHANEINKNSEGVFSTVPDEDDLSLIEQGNQSVKSWIIDENGNKKYVTNKIMGSITPSYVVGRLVYTFIRYDQNVTKSNNYQHFVSSVSLLNTTQDPIPLKYTQQNSKSNTWTVIGKVEAEAEFKVAVLAKLKASFSASVTDSWTTASSSSVEFTMNVPVGKTGKISKYYAGKYSGGQGVWRVQDVIGGYEPFTYYEEAGAWGIEKNEVNYKATTY